MEISRKQLRKAILIEMQNNDTSHYYPKLSQLLLSPEHEVLVQAILLGETLKILKKKSWRPGEYNPDYKTYQYELNLKADFARYLQQNYPNPPQHLGPSYKGQPVPDHHYIHYNFRPDIGHNSMSISIHIEFR